MATTNTRSVVGVFSNRENADRAVSELERAGFNMDQIGYAVRQPGADQTNATVARAGNVGADVATGAVSGGVIGGVLGAGAALLIPGFGPVLAGGILASALGGAAIGAAAGGILGALTDVGVPENEARYYQSEFEAGRTIVTVRADGRQEKALEILRRYGAYDATTRPAAASNIRGTTNQGTTIGTAYGTTNWQNEAPRYRNAWQQRYGNTGGRWEDYEPLYRYGWEAANNPQYGGRNWGFVEPELRRDWENRYPNVAWNDASNDVREAWENGRIVTHPQDDTSVYNG